MDAHKERQEILKQYVLRCMRAGVLSWSDLTKPDVLLQRFSKIAVADARAVFADLKQRGESILSIGLDVGVGIGTEKVKGLINKWLKG